MDNLYQQIKQWEALLDKIYKSLMSNSENYRGYDRKDIKHYTAFTIKHSLFFSFNSIKTLIEHGRYFDSFSLLRPFFESHLTLWRIINNDENITKEFINRALKIKHNIDVEYNKMFKEEYNDYYNEELLTPVDITNDYWDVSMEKITETIDRCENNSWPYYSLMSIRLHSAGSEYIHRSSFSIDEGLSLVKVPESKIEVVNNPNLGIETAWWASLIIIDSEKWYTKLLNERFDSNLTELRNKAMELASNWTNRK